MSTPTTLTFGKHRGREIADVFAEDPSYCRWVFTQDNDASDEIREFLAQHFDRDDNSYILRWGKFRGQSLKQVHAHAPAYIKWLKSSAFVNDKCPRLRADLEAFD